MADEVEFVSDEDIPRVGKHVSSYERNTFSVEKPVSGTEVFGFKTPKRRGALAQAASSAVHKKTPQIQRNKTPSSKKKDVQGHNSTRKAKQVIPTVGTGKENINTRYSLRCRRQAMFMKDTERESESDDSNSTTEETVSRAFSTEPGKGHVILTDTPEEYFYQQSSKCVTSDHTLSKLHVPHMDQQNLQIHLSEMSFTHPKERFDIYHRLQPLFNKWIFHMKNGFNILLYGLGSKRVLLDQFRCSKLVECMQVVVNGFFPSLTIKNVLNTITEEGLGYEGTFRSLMDQCDFIKRDLSSDTRTEEIYLIIHNIDGSMLRSKKSQTVLSLLAEVDALHIIATIDHINAPLIWNHTQLGRFNWLWFDVTSFEPYKEETSYENSLLVQRTGALALSSLVHVFRSLTPNARGIFLLITGNQLEEKDNTAYIGLSFTECYTKCREQFLVNSELTLRAQLTEFRDHKLIRSKKGSDGVEYLYIPVDLSTLKQFIDDQKNNT